MGAQASVPLPPEPLGTSEAGLCVGAYLFQMLLVQAGNSRWFQKPGSGFYTNVEMAERYPSLATPAGFAFAIWGVIYLGETIGMGYLMKLALDGAPPISGWSTPLWLTANACQGLWALAFSADLLAPSAVALGGIAASLMALGSALAGATGLAYALVAAPLWLHAGWVTAATIVNFNLVLVPRASAAVQYAAATASSYAALAAGTTALCVAGTPALPASLALAWALHGIRSNLRGAPKSRGIVHGPAFAEVGGPARHALEITIGACIGALLAVAAFIASR